MTSSLPVPILHLPQCCHYIHLHILGYGGVNTTHTSCIYTMPHKWWNWQLMSIGSVQIAAGCGKYKGIAACPATNWLWNLTKRPTFCTKDGRDFNLFTTAADFTYKGHRATPNTTTTQIAATGWSNEVLRHVWACFRMNYCTRWSSISARRT